MKKHHSFEAIAVIFAALGVMVLVGGLMPFINPGFVDANHVGEYSPRMEFLVPTLLSLPLLGIAWHFNKKAQEFKREQEEAGQTSEPPWQRKLKWIFFAMVATLVLYAFLW